MNLKLTVDGEQKFNFAIDSISEGIKDFRPVWPEIEQEFYRMEREQFDSEGSRGGQKWAPLSPAYAKWKAIKAPGAPILVLSGRLRESLQGGADSIKDAQPDSLTLGSSVPYAIYHQRGTPRLKRRPPIALLRNDMGKFTSRVFRFAERIGKASGFKVEGKAGVI